MCSYMDDHEHIGNYIDSNCMGNLARRMEKTIGELFKFILKKATGDLAKSSISSGGDFLDPPIADLNVPQFAAAPAGCDG